MSEDQGQWIVLALAFVLLVLLNLRISCVSRRIDNLWDYLRICNNKMPVDFDATVELQKMRGYDDGN